MDLSSSASKHKSLGIAAMIRPSDNGLLPPVNHKSECYSGHYSSHSLLLSSLYYMWAVLVKHLMKHTKSVSEVVVNCGVNIQRHLLL